MKNLLENGCELKLICGASNNNLIEVENIVSLYSSIGCKFFDVCADIEVLKSAKKGLRYAKYDKNFICVSIGLKDDPHVCSHNCKNCVNTCTNHEILYELIENGIDCIELHAITSNIEAIRKKWEFLNEIYDGFLSICFDRSKLSDDNLIELTKELIAKRKPYTTTIQTDGNPISGFNDEYQTTLQSVAFGELIQKQNLRAYLILSGGTNSKTKKLSKLCKVKPNAIAIGSYAKKIVKNYIEKSDFLTNKKNFLTAQKIALKLFNSVKEI